MLIFSELQTLGVLSPLLGISPGSASKRECGDSSAAEFGEVAQGGEDWELCSLYGVKNAWLEEVWSIININEPQASWLPL